MHKLLKPWDYLILTASKREKQAWITAERYSLEEIVNLVDYGFFYKRRVDNRVKIDRRKQY